MATETEDKRASTPRHSRTAPPLSGFRKRLATLYFGDTAFARLFRYGLLVFDLIIIAFFVISSIVAEEPWFLPVDYALAVILTADLVARLLASERPGRAAAQGSTLFDFIVILSLAVPAIFENLAFLRVVRMLRLLRSYHVLGELRRHSRWFRRHEDVIQSAVNLAVFVFVVTAVVFVIEGKRNPAIENYFDALYFTVATLTTTGFGDITMSDTAGRLLTVVIMVFGVALFLRLIQTVFRPSKVLFPCPTCGLKRHDPDAVHCKHCGTVLNIPTEGEWT